MTMYGRHHSEETKKKMSDAHKGGKHYYYGKHLSEGHKKKLSDSHKGKYTGEKNPFYGKHHSEESRKKISDARKGGKNPFYGKYHSEETKTKMSDAHTGKHLSEETKTKISDARKGEKHPFYGKHHSEETRKKMSAAQKGEKHPLYGKHHSEEAKKKISDVNKGENNSMYGKHHSEETRKKIGDAHTDWDFVREFGTTRGNYPYSMFFDGKHKKMIRELYGNRCIITGVTQEEYIDKYGIKLSVHHWNHDKDSEDLFFMIPVACNINSICHSNGENKHEWISLFNGIAEDKWCEMLKNGTLKEFYKKFGYDINNCCYIKNI